MQWVVASALFLLGVQAMAADSAGFSLTVSAGATARRDCIVEFALPEGLKTTPTALKDPAGKWLPVQVGLDGKACFLLPALEANQSLTLEAVTGGDVAQAVKAEAAEGRVAFTVQGKPVLTYLHAKTPLPDGYDAAFQRGGYIFPVLTPSGKLVVDDYPPNHKHHHGLWAAWTKTAFDGRTPDFWNMGGKTGTVEPVALDASWSGPVHGGFKARHQYVDLKAQPKPVTVLNEIWEGRVYSVGEADAKYRVLDLNIRQTCATDQPLKLPKYHYGGIGIRGNRAWDGKGNMTTLTSEGKARETANESTGRWCHLGGQVDGEPAGIAVLCHPSNFRAPQPMRVHPTEPFFCYAPSQGGDWEIKPGDTYTMRYRFIVADGPADKTELDRLWTDYAEPPKVDVKKNP
jgi:hypothetical protein